MYTLYKRGRCWYVQWVLDGTQVRRTTKCERKSEAKAVAERLYREAAAARNKGTTVGYVLVELAKDNARAGYSEKWNMVRDSQIDHLLRFLGEQTPVIDVTPERLREYADWRLTHTKGKTGQSRISKHTVQKEIGAWRKALLLCGEKWDQRWMPNLGTVYEPRDRWLPHDEYVRLLDALPADRGEYVTTLCYTGLDLTPLYRLTADSIKRGSPWRIWCDDKKSKHRRRWIPVHDTVKPILARRAKEQPAQLFPVWHSMRRDLHVACKRADIEPCSAKDFRRTFASWLANKGVSMKVTADLMGHASLDMVQRVYARLGTEIVDEAVERL